MIVDPPNGRLGERSALGPLVREIDPRHDSAGIRFIGREPVGRRLALLAVGTAGENPVIKLPVAGYANLRHEWPLSTCTTTKGTGTSWTIDRTRTRSASQGPGWNDFGPGASSKYSTRLSGPSNRRSLANSLRLVGAGVVHGVTAQRRARAAGQGGVQRHLPPT